MIVRNQLIKAHTQTEKCEMLLCVCIYMCVCAYVVRN